MEKILNVLKRNKTNIAGILIAVLITIGVIKGVQYGSAPTKDKDCNYIYPESDDQTKPTNIVLAKAEIPVSFEQKGGLINDASCLNKTAIYGIVKIASPQDVQQALTFAKDNNLKVTSAGQRHSMGGQSFIKDGLVLDMRSYNGMTLDAKNKILKVQSGAKWADVQEYLDKQGLSVKAMQSINIFTVGGTLSVNAHGIAHDPGQIASTVRSMTVVTADGKITTASPTNNPELFKHVLGGYGLFGVILDVDLDVVPNEVYDWSKIYMDYKDFTDYYKKNIDNNSKIGLMYGRLSVSPGSYLTEAVVNAFEKTDYSGTVPGLQPTGLTWFSRLVINFSKTGSFGRWVRWMLEKHLEPKLHTCVTRNQAMSANEVCDVSRNQEMYDSMGYLKNKLADTDILQEYFIPPEKMTEFVDGLKKVVKEDRSNLLNVTIRIVHNDTITSLPYARGDRFAFVLYFNQKFNQKESEDLKQTTNDLIDLANNLGGSYYLPYQLFYTKDQLQKAYPDIETFFAVKKKLDPTILFDNTWYEKYSY